MGLMVCTIAARNYLPQVRVLAESFRSTHPNGRIVALILDDVDEEVDSGTEPFEVWRLGDLGIDTEELHRMAMIYDLMEFATALKPWLLESILDSGVPSVLYLDPDIQIFSALDHLGDLAAEHGIALTPHTTVPYPRDGKKTDEEGILSAGIYNLGFIGVGQSSRPFLSFWQERLRRDCVLDPESMLFVDQRWVDFVPGLYDHIIVKDPGYNVAYWNLHGRSLRWTGARYEVDGHPLGFFHFSGYSPTSPHLLSKHQGDRPRILLSEHPDIARICDEYGELLIEHGFGARSLPYALNRMADGSLIDDAVRHLYRQWVEKAEKAGDPLPPDPYNPAQVGEVLSLLNQPAKRDGRPGNLTFYLATLYACRPRIHARFPDPQDADRAEFLEWAQGEATAGRMAPALATMPNPPDDEDSSVVTLRGTASEWAPPDRLRPGITIAGYLTSELGVGEGARLTARTVEATGLDFTLVTTTDTLSRQQHPVGIGAGKRRDFDTNLIAVNADRLPDFASEVGSGFFEGRYTIGQWAWELEEFPEEFLPALNIVHEVWALSEFNRSSIAKVTDKPVFAVPLPIVEPIVAPGATRATFGLPDRFMFLFCFDLFSIIERKNPLGLIEAFTQAFSPGEGPILVLKVINSEQCIGGLEQIRRAVDNRPDVMIIDRYLDHDEQAALTSMADCYVSLHRSEGFGLTMAEAMALGKPVIATGYSGNLDFMSADTAYLVPWTPGQVPAGCYPYPQGATWADPDLGVAADMMRYVVTHPEEAADKGRAGRQSVLNEHGVEQRTAFMRKRFADIQQDRATAAAIGQQAATTGVPPKLLGAVTRQVKRRWPATERTATTVGRDEER